MIISQSILGDLGLMYLSLNKNTAESSGTRHEDGGMTGGEGRTGELSLTGDKSLLSRGEEMR